MMETSQGTDPMINISAPHLSEEYGFRELHPIPLKDLGEGLKHIPSRIEAVMAHAKSQYWSLLPAFQLLTPTPVEEPIKHFATDGKHLFYNPARVDKRIRRLGEFAANTRFSAELLHIVIHGILGHFEAEYKDEKLSWAIMDLLVDRFIRYCFPAEIRKDRTIEDGETSSWKKTDPEVDEFFSMSDNEERLATLLEKGLGAYYVIESQKKSREFILHQALRRCLDNHHIWHQKPQGANGGGQESQSTGEGGPNGTGDGESQSMGGGKPQNASEWREVAAELLGIPKPDKADAEELQEAISKLTGKGGKRQGFGAGEGEEELKVTHRSRSNYTSTLKKLCREREAAHENPDSIDHMLYQYGLDMYGDVPLVEPTDENPQLQLEHIVLAVDTSGSCSGPVAELFLEETVRIFENVGALAKPKLIHLVECDTEVQNVIRFKSIQDMKNYASGQVTFHGYGGTSFVPVYEWIEEYNKKHRSEKITALFYLTDGYGDFPDDNKEIQDTIRSFFILPEEDYENLENQFKERPWITPLEIKGTMRISEDEECWDYDD